MEPHSEHAGADLLPAESPAIIAEMPPEPGTEHSHVPTRYHPRAQRRVVVFAIVTAVVLLGVVLIVSHSRRSSDNTLFDAAAASSAAPVNVDVVRVSRAAVQHLLTLPGEARAFYETTLFARTSGYVSKWMVDIGDSVKEGQALATIETPELDDQLHEERAKLAQLQAQAHIAAASAEFARLSFNRWEAAAPDGVVSAQERDQKKSELESSLARLEAAKAEVNLGAAGLQRLETLEKFKTVVAPFDGVVTQRHIDIGALVTAGSTTNTTPLYTVSQAQQIRVYVDVPQAAAPEIRVGMHAFAMARELPGEIFSGVVDRTASSIDAKSRTLKVAVLVPNKSLQLLPGMYVQVSFETDRRNPPLRIPAAALAFGVDGPHAAVVNADGQVKFHPVAIARDLGYAVEIASGLEENDLVALNVGNQVVDGDRVEAHVVEAASDPAPAAPTRFSATTRPALTAQASH